jgi:hypothetical protein
MLRRVALVIADVSEELSASIMWVTRIGEPPVLVTLLRGELYLFICSYIRTSQETRVCVVCYGDSVTFTPTSHVSIILNN